MSRSIQQTITAVMLAGLAAISTVRTAGGADREISLPANHVERSRETLDARIDDLRIEDAAPQSAVPRWRTREQLLGDIGGLRPWLARHGTSLEIETVHEGFGNLDGAGTRRNGRHAGLSDIVLSLDSEAAGLWRGGTIVVDLQNVHGGDISEAVGDIQGVSNIAGPSGTRLAEYYLTQELAGGTITVKLGKQDANADFVVSDGGGELINSSFGIVPTVPLPTYPAPALGIMAGWSPSPRVRLKAGVWDGAPAVGSGCLATAFDGGGGTVAAVAVEARPFAGKVLAGTYRVGVWRHSEVELSPAGKVAMGRDMGAASGIYFTADQDLWRGGGRSLQLFAQGGWAEGDRSAVSRYLGGGLILRSPLAGRPDDVLGLGIAHAEIGDTERLSPDCSSETVVELFYRLPVMGWLSLQPDLQLVRRPHGLSGRTAVVAGVRLAAVL